MCIISSSRGAPPPARPLAARRSHYTPAGGKPPATPRARALRTLCLFARRISAGRARCAAPAAHAAAHVRKHACAPICTAKRWQTSHKARAPYPSPRGGGAPPSGISCAKRGKKCENKVCNKQSNTATPAPTVAVVRRGARAPTGAYSLELFAQARSTAAMAIVASLIKRKFYIIAGKKRPPQLRKSGRLFPQLARCGLFCALSFRALGTVQRTMGRSYQCRTVRQQKTIYYICYLFISI